MFEPAAVAPKAVHCKSKTNKIFMQISPYITYDFRGAKQKYFDFGPFYALFAL